MGQDLCNISAVLNIVSYEDNSNFLIQECAWVDLTGNVQLFRVRQPTLLSKTKFSSYSSKALSSASVYFKTPANLNIWWISVKKMKKIIASYFTALETETYKLGNTKCVIGISDKDSASEIFLRGLNIPYKKLSSEHQTCESANEPVTHFFNNCNNHPKLYDSSVYCSLSLVTQLAKKLNWFSLDMIINSNVFKNKDFFNLELFEKKP